MTFRSGFVILRLMSGFLLLFGLVLGHFSPALAAGPRCYVKAGGAGSGTSWGDAYGDLQNALADPLCMEVWVAAGTYTPTKDKDRTISFALKSGVSIYGGFAGSEDSLSQRNPAGNQTILSGEIDEPGNLDNSHHVVVASSVDNTALLDGFTITSGNADGDPALGYSFGGGMYSQSASPSLVNLIFTGNSASSGGGGMYIELGAPDLTNVTFAGNTAVDGGGIYNIDAAGLSLDHVTFANNLAAQQGGGMHSMYSVLSLADVTFNGNSAQYGGGMSNFVSTPGLAGTALIGNTAALWGGGMYNDFSSPTLAQVNFEANHAGQRGGGMYNSNGSKPNLENVTFTSNAAGFSGGGMFNHSSSPNLVNVAFHANSTGEEGFGGGMINLSANPTLLNVVFSGNTSQVGGGIYNQESSPSLSGVTFSGNSAQAEGGGMNNFSSSNPALVNVTFHGNSAFSGGGMYNEASSPNLTHVTFSGNNALTGGAIMGDGTVITNSILYGDGGGEISGVAEVSYSIIQGGHSGTGNLDADPLLKPLGSYGGFTQTMPLGPGSPAIDTGTNTGCPANDQRGIPRPHEGNGIGTAACDMGATESRFLAQTFRSTGSQDGLVLESSETSGKGGTINVSGVTFLLGDNEQDRQYRGILSFNTDSIPEDAVIRSVTLKVKRAGLAGTDPFTTHGSLLVDVRKGPFSNNAGLQNGDFQALAGKSAVMILPGKPVSGWYSRSMTAASFIHINLAGITQFRLRFAKDDNDDLNADILKLYSGNSATTAYRPQVIISYYIP